MLKQKFITSFLTFYLKAEIGLEGPFVKFKRPNTILKVIPLGAASRTIPIEQISTVDTNFKLEFGSFIWGLIILFAGLSMLSESPVGAIVAIIWGALTLLSSFQTILGIGLTSGQQETLSVIIFEKTKLEEVQHTIQEVIAKRYDDTNAMKAADHNADKIIAGLKG